MARTDFSLGFKDIDDYRLVRVEMPAVVDIHRLSVVTSKYLSLFVDDRPIVVLNDAVDLLELQPDVQEVLLAMMKRNVARPLFVGSAWITRGDEEIDGIIRELLVIADRDPDVIFRTESDALGCLDSMLEQYRSTRSN
ncbi:MAG: hypothetical protein IT175_17110 [Acidobacteria bacterium]|nr:hypothetical protein [Acidobacteriota bacterium]